jgi:hypothetical protein
MSCAIHYRKKVSETARAREGATKSMCMCSKRRIGTGIASGDECICMDIFPRWQKRHCHAKFLISVAMQGQQNEDNTNFTKARMPG